MKMRSVKYLDSSAPKNTNLNETDNQEVLEMSEMKRVMVDQSAAAAAVLHQVKMKVNGQ